MGRVAVSVSAALVALAFACSTFERWLARRRRHELAWSGALALFVVAATALAVGAGLGWTGPTFRVFYLFGAILDVPFLALGTVYLLAGRHTGDRHTLVQGSHVFGALPRVLAGVASGVGATFIVLGAAWSIVRQRRARAVVSNGLIIAGTLVLGASGLFNSVLDAMTAFAVALMVGIALVFAGFLVATAATPPAASGGASVTPLRARTG